MKETETYHTKMVNTTDEKYPDTLKVTGSQYTCDEREIITMELNETHMVSFYL